MRWFLCPALVSVVILGPPIQTPYDADIVLSQPPFVFHSSFWTNLHYALYAVAWATRPASGQPSAAGPLPEPLGGDLSAAEREVWNRAVRYYDEEIADLDFFEMLPIRKALLNDGVDVPAGLGAVHREMLGSAAPIYRKYWWAMHDRANRQWIRTAAPRVVALSPAVTDRLARLFGQRPIANGTRVDLIWVGPSEGAFTSLDPAPAHITISTGNPAFVDWTAAEILIHESWHVPFIPIMREFAAESRTQRKDSEDLWHLALFYATGEVVRQALAERHVSYEPYLYKTGLLERHWPQFKTPIETTWQTFIDGKLPRDVAIQRLVATVAKRGPGRWDWVEIPLLNVIIVVAVTFWLWRRRVRSRSRHAAG